MYDRLEMVKNLVYADLIKKPCWQLILLMCAALDKRFEIVYIKHDIVEIIQNHFEDLKTHLPPFYQTTITNKENLVFMFVYNADEAQLDNICKLLLHKGTDVSLPAMQNACETQNSEKTNYRPNKNKILSI